MILLNPLEDGITHINVYSKGKTELGRLLSNFAHTPFTLDPEGTFASVEAYWYWILTGQNELKSKFGYEAKRLGKSFLKTEENVTETQLARAYTAKLEQTPGLLEKLSQNKLPLVHYYVHEGRVVNASKWFWTATLWNKIIDNKKIE